MYTWHKKNVAPGHCGDTMSALDCLPRSYFLKYPNLKSPFRGSLFLVSKPNPESESEIASCSVVSNSLRVHGLYSLQDYIILQARILEWVAFPFSRRSSQPRSPALQADSLPVEPQRKPKNTGMGSLSLLQWIFLESNQGLLHCRQILYQLSYQGT